MTKQALIMDDFHNVSSPFVRELDNNNDEITKPIEEFDLSNLHENNHELKDGSHLDFVIRKHGRDPDPRRLEMCCRISLGPSSDRAQKTLFTTKHEKCVRKAL